MATGKQQNKNLEIESIKSLATIKVSVPCYKGVFREGGQLLLQVT